MNDQRPIQLTHEQLRSVVKDTVSETLVRMGIDAEDPIEMQKDFSHLRQWRTATDSARTKGVVALVGILVTGICAAVWMGLQQMLEK